MSALCGLGCRERSRLRRHRPSGFDPSRKSHPGPTAFKAKSQAVHRHLFQDVYRWAGRFRTVRISEGGSMFCYPELIPGQIATLFADLKDKRYFRGLDATAFASQAAHFLSELNAIHPFREGNGRAQLAFLALLAERAGHELQFERMQPEAMLGGHDT